MYKIVNNNISITRGETATYNVKVIDKTTGAPFILPKSAPKGYLDDVALSDFAIVFSVRRSDYIKDGYAMKKILWLCPINSGELGENEYDCSQYTILLDDTKIYNYLDTEDADWDPEYFGESGSRLDTKTGDTQTKDLMACFRRQLPDGTYEYKYWNKTAWIPYSFEIRFPFVYADTSTLSPKSYKYSMTIYGGNNLTIEDGRVKEDTISYKKPLVDANFIVEADINE